LDEAEKGDSDGDFVFGKDCLDGYVWRLKSEAKAGAEDDLYIDVSMREGRRTYFKYLISNPLSTTRVYCPGRDQCCAYDCYSRANDENRRVVANFTRDDASSYDEENVAEQQRYQ